MGGGHDLHIVVENAAYLLFEATEPLLLPEADRRTGLSTSHLSRLFKEQMGVSPTA